MPSFELAVFGASVVSGATAAVAGFGIGSLLTPLLMTSIDATTAIAAVAIPHAFASTLRCFRLRGSIDWGVLRSFGLLSAAGAILGALLYARVSSDTLTLLLGILLLATAVAGLTNWMVRVRLGVRTAGALGFASGLFGGAAGNQGGLRAAALLAFPLSPVAFVATSTAAGLIVDAARLPLYLARAGNTLRPYVFIIALASAGVLLGTLVGERLLLGMSRERFRQLVSACVGALGVWLLARVA